MTARYDRGMGNLTDATYSLALVGLLGIVVTVTFSRRQQRTTENLVGLMRAQEQARRTPRLSAEIIFDQYLKLVVWLDSGEELASLRLMLTEACDYDCPVGFRVGAEGVPAFESMDEKSLRSGGWWDTAGEHWAVTVRPYADVPKRLSPGHGVTFGLEKRANASQSSTSRAIRLKARCRADDGSEWEVNIPASARPDAAGVIDARAAERA